MGYYKCTDKDVIVVHDELALDFATVRCKQSGGHGGHNGLRDTIKHIGNSFLRVRMGIGFLVEIKRDMSSHSSTAKNNLRWTRISIKVWKR